MAISIRKLCSFMETLHREGRPLARPFVQVASVAVFENPWLGRGFVEDLSPEVSEISPHLGAMLAEDCIERLGGPENVVCFGKAALVGLRGEIEHANVLIHTKSFGDPIRTAIAGITWMVSSQKRGGTGSSLDVPVAHKTIDKNQASYHSIEIRVPDAPFEDEILIAVAMTNSLRPQARPKKDS